MSVRVLPKPTPARARPPAEFVIQRGLRSGQHALLDLFPGLSKGVPFRSYPASARAREALAKRTVVEIVRREGEWMYVAPHEVPPDADARWKPVVNAGDCIVVGNEYVRRGRSIDLYLDIHHELLHVFQRAAGRELWDDKFEYVDRPTEIEAYGFAVTEARRLGISDAFLRKYLKVPWVSKKDHLRLLSHLGVSAE